MTHRKSSFPLALILLCLAIVHSHFSTGLFAEEKPLNILWIIADDMSKELGFYGEEEVISPNLDRLASEGLVFDHAYAQYPVCNASRTSFLMSWYPDRSGIYSNRVQFRKEYPEAITLPQWFRKQGYAVGGIGKILHAGMDKTGDYALFRDDISFDYFADYLRVMDRNSFKGEGRNLTNGELGWCRWMAFKGGDQVHADGMGSADAVRWLRENGDQPFFLSVGLHKPHDPFFAPKEYFDLYPEGSITLNPPPEGRTPTLEAATPRSTQAVFDKFTDKERMEFKRAYYSCITFMDAQVGKLLDELERQGLDDNTMVIFMSDHGYHLGEHDWWNKVTLFEIGTNVPFIMKVPGKPASGSRTEALIELIDLFPTFAELAGVPAPPDLDGQSFAHLMDDPGAKAKSAAFTQVTRGQKMGRSIRVDGWRYTEWDFGHDGIELYSHPQDPYEYHNLAHKPELADLQAHLKKLLDAHFSAPGGRP